MGVTFGEVITASQMVYITVLTFPAKDASEDIITSDILGTQEGIEALIKFLVATNAFKKQRIPPEVAPAQQ